MSKSKERAVIVTTERKCIFFGYATDTDGDVINLRAARCAVYWTSDLRGFMGLAHYGPNKGCRIGPPADIQLRHIECVIEVSDNAAKKWEEAPWSV